MNHWKKRKTKKIAALLLSLSFILTGCDGKELEEKQEELPNVQAQVKEENQSNAVDNNLQQNGQSQPPEQPNGFPDAPPNGFQNDSPENNQKETVSSEELVEIAELGSISYEKEDQTDTWESDACLITLSGKKADIAGTGAVFEDGDLKITAAGTYVVSGTLTDGQIVIKAGEEAKVHLILNGVSISCEDSAAIYMKKTGKVILTLAKDTINTLTDGTSYVYDDTEKEEPSAALFSKCDLVINGSGALNINARFNDGITCKDSLLIVDGIVSITSVDDGIIGRDKLQILGGTFSLQTKGDGLKTTNDTDETVGNLMIEGGNFTITAEADAVQAEYALKITNGTFQIKTGEGSDNNFFGTAASSSESTKGFKSGTSTEIIGGEFVLDCADDALHTNGSMLITGGNFEIRTGDDGVHADSELTILGGTIQINQSYEGLEAQSIKIKDGTIYVMASDDGVNAAGGADGSGQGGRFGMDRFSSGTAQVVIEGGYLVISSDGDGLDSNGSVTMEGGTVLINGPTNGGNGALDYDSAFTINGGILVASGSSGMVQSVSSGTQNCISMTFSSVQSANTTVSLNNAAGETLLSFAPTKQFQNIIISIPELSKEESYTLCTGGHVSEEKDGLGKGTILGAEKVVSFTLSDAILWLNESGVTQNNQNGWMGRPGGGHKGNGTKGFR